MWLITIDNSHLLPSTSVRRRMSISTDSKIIYFCAFFFVPSIETRFNMFSLETDAYLLDEKKKEWKLSQSFFSLSLSFSHLCTFFAFFHMSKSWTISRLFFYRSCRKERERGIKNRNIYDDFFLYVCGGVLLNWIMITFFCGINFFFLAKLNHNSN